MNTKDLSTTDSSASDKPPGSRQPNSFLVDETGTMERKRRLEEQDGHRKRARVNAREHDDELSQHSLFDQEFEQQAGNLQHPALNNQLFDGIDLNLSPYPTQAEIENALREQEMEHKLRLGLLPKMGTAPRPDKP